jgi:hypothetical protein
MAIAKLHPVANWLRCSGDVYRQTWDRVSQLRDADYAAQRFDSGLPSGAKDWFLNIQLPTLVQFDFYRKQTEERISDLDKKHQQIEKDVKPLIDAKLKEQAALIDEKNLLLRILNG